MPVLSFRVARACPALVIAFLLAACGGGGGAPSEPLLPPPELPDVPHLPPPGPTTFQAATVFVGQPDAEHGEANQGQGTSAQGFNRPGGLAVTPQGGLLVADRSNNRVLFFPSVLAPAVEAIGQPAGPQNLETSSPSLTQGGLNSPFGVAVGAGLMAVADTEANRVLIYNRGPEPGAPMPEPVVVIGQLNFESADPGCANGLNSPTAVTITPDGKLIVADSGNHRVLVWDSVPVADPVAQPTMVLGQRGPQTCLPNDNVQNPQVAGRATLLFPTDVWSNDQRLVVADAGNNRVLIWRDFPSGNFAEADIVLGHRNFTDSAPNSPDEQEGSLAAPTESTLSDPEGVHSDGTALAVADALNNRVLIWTTFPETDFQAADVVLGHQGFNQSVSNDLNGDQAPDAPTAHIFNYPVRVLFTQGSLIVTDLFHHRVMLFAR